jgi:hypothetical protein
VGPIAEALVSAGSRFSREQLDRIRMFLRLGAELSYRRAEELSTEVAGGARPSTRPRSDTETGRYDPISSYEGGSFPNSS